MLQFKRPLLFFMLLQKLLVFVSTIFAIFLDSSAEFANKLFVSLELFVFLDFHLSLVFSEIFFKLLQLEFTLAQLHPQLLAFILSIIILNMLG
jgi:hypothetical protein